MEVGGEVLETPQDVPEESDEEGDGMSTDQQVQDALQNLTSARDIEVLLRPCDTEEEEMVAQFASAGCGCSKKCSSQFSVNYVRDIRAQCYDLTHSELDMVLLGQLMASTNTSEKVVVDSGHLEVERKRCYTTFYHAGKVVCGKTFRFLHTVGSKRLNQKLQKPRTNTTHTWKYTQTTKALTVI